MSATILLFFNGLAFVLTGLLGLVKPDPFAGSVGLGLDGAAGHNEFLGTFGGLYLAVGLLLLMPRPLDQQARLWLLVALAGGLAVGRLWALLQYGRPETAQLAYFGWEATSALLALFLLLSKR